MDGQLLCWLYRRLKALHTCDCTYSDGLIALFCLYAAANNRSLRWASCRRHWPIWCQRCLAWP